MAKITALLIVALVVGSAMAGLRIPEREYETAWAKWKSQHNKVYATQVEHDVRFTIFKDNMDRIAKHNSDKSQTYTMKMNHFGDLTQHEFTTQMNRLQVPKVAPTGRKVHYAKAGVTGGDIDWVAKGAVTTVKNQEQCGSCWAFSTCGAIEGAYALKMGNNKTSFAPQQLVDCDTQSDHGCNGGLMDNAFTYLESHSICNWNDYPYEGVQGSCQSCDGVVKVADYTDVDKNEDALSDALQLQPIAIAVDAEPWQFYNGGVFSKTCGQQLDHGVLLVGQGSDNGQDYWKVKNSWGPSWGEDGYIRIKKGSNECGISNMPSYPSV